MMDHEPNEYELALRARDGDREALAELVERTRLRLFALAYAELRHYEDAQDAVASALLQICLHVGELRQPERLRAWMQTIVRNEVRRLRRGAGGPMMSLEEAERQPEAAKPLLLRLDIERALQRLPADQANVIRLFYLDHLSAREIAERLGRTKGTITGWLHRGRQRLANELEEYAPMKRREALKLLAATPALATTLEEGAAMTPEAQEATPQTAPPSPVAIVHTELEPAPLQKATEALQAGGHCVTVITPTDLAQLVDTLKPFLVLVLDEWILGRSALELVMHLKASVDTRGIPTCLLCAAPSDFTVSAYFTAGVGRLVDKTKPADFAKLSTPFEKPTTSNAGWQRFTERARRVVFFAQEEAARLGENYVGTEHLLLGLVRENDSVAARILDRMGISGGQVRSDVEGQVTRGSGNLGQDMKLTPQGKRVIDLAYEEARLLKNDYIGTEHLLLGLIREGDGLAARVLVKLGADLERTRREVYAIQEE
jgi:RNA polymerase sigma factor (sigma-70 family)